MAREEVSATRDVSTRRALDERTNVAGDDEITHPANPRMFRRSLETSVYKLPNGTLTEAMSDVTARFALALGRRLTAVFVHRADLRCTNREVGGAFYRK